MAYEMERNVYETWVCYMYVNNVGMLYVEELTRGSSMLIEIAMTNIEIVNGCMEP